VAALATLLTAAVLILPYLLDLPRVQALAAAHASQAFGRPVRFAAVSVRLLPTPRVELRGLEVAEDPRFGAGPFVTLERGFVPLRVRPLLRGRLEFGELRLESPLIRLVEAADGALNVASLGVVREAAARLPPIIPGREPHAKGAGAGAALLAAGISIEKGTLTFVSRSPGRAEYRLVDLDLRLRGDGPGLAFEGRGTLAPGQAAIRLAHGRLALRGVRSLADAPLAGQISVDAADIGPMVAALAPSGLGARGLLQGHFTLSGVLGAPRVSGRVQLAPAAITRLDRGCAPPERALGVDEMALPAQWDGRALLARPLTARVAGGDVSANLEATLEGDLRVVVSDLAARGLSLDRLLVDFLCHGYAVTGRLDLTAGLAFRVAGFPGSVSGDGRFQIGRGRVVGPRALRLFGDAVKAVDLASSLVGEALPSPLEFEAITGTYRLHDGLATTRDVVYTARGFTALASGEYALTSGALNVDLLVRHRREQVKAHVTGTAEAPVLRVDALGSLRAVDSRQAERGLQNVLRRLR
jgi:AsmA protein